MGILGSLFGGGGGTPKYLKKAGSKVMDRAFEEYNKAAYVPWEGDAPIAQMNNVLSSAINRAGDVADAGAGFFNDAKDAVSAIPGANAITSRAPDIADTVVGAVNKINPATLARSAVREVMPGSFDSVDMSKYMNPYIANVIDAAMGRLGHQREEMRVADKAAGAGAGAFTNDPRMQVLTAETTGRFDRTAADTIAGLYNQGFDTASGLAMQDLGRGYDASLANAQSDLAVGSLNTDAANRAALANQQTGLGTSLAQAEIDAAAEQARAGYAMDADKLNIMAELERAGLDADTALKRGGLMAELGRAEQQGAMQGIDAALRAGSMQQQYDDRTPQFEYEQFLRRADWPFKRMGLLTGAIGAIGGQRSNTSNGIFDQIGIDTGG